MVLNLIQEYTTLKMIYPSFPASLKPFQVESIQGLMSGKDVVLISPTASGKTLPFIVGPLIINPIGPITILVLPLDSLMMDMQKRLAEFGLPNCIYKTEELQGNTFK